MNLYAIVTLALSLLFTSCGLRQERADLILHNATIFTVDSRFSKAEAAAVKNGIIIDVGAEREILNRYQSKNTIDLRKAFVYPGFSANINGGAFAVRTESESLPEIKAELLSRGVTGLRINGLSHPEVEKLSHALRDDSSSFTYYVSVPIEDAKKPKITGRNLHIAGIHLRDPFSDPVQNTGIRYALEHNLPVHAEADDTESVDRFFKLCDSVLGEVNDRRWILHIDIPLDPEQREKLAKYTIIPQIGGSDRDPGKYLAANGILLLAGEEPPKVLRETIKNGLSPRDAIRALTIWPALAAFAEEERGSIEPGKRADFTVLNRDLTKAGENDFSNLEVLRTFTAGTQSFKSE